MASTKINQSRKLIVKATNLFTTAIKDVEKANELLSQSIIEDNDHIEVTKDSIKNKELFIQDLETQKTNKNIEWKNNENLIRKLKEFSVS